MLILFDAIERLVSYAHLHYTRTRKVGRLISLARMRGEVDIEKEESAWTAIMAETGSLISTIHRIGLLIARLPGDNDIRVARKAFEAAVREVHEVRHHLEHLDERIAEIATTSGQGAFGAISWWYFDPEGKEGVCTMIAAGPITKGTLVVTKVPSLMRGDVDHFWVLIGGTPIDISDMYWAVATLEKRLRTWGQGQEKDGWPSLPTWRYR